MRRVPLLVGLLVLVLCLIGLACTAAPSAPQSAARQSTAPKATATPDEDDEETEGARPGSAPTQTPRPLPTASAGGYQLQVVADRLVLPSSLAFAPDGRLFFVEVKSNVLRVIANGELQPAPVLTVDGARGAEHGLIGLAIDPGFSQNHYLYTYYTQALKGNDAGRPRRNRLTRWTESNGTASGETAVLDNLPFGKCCHTGGKMAWGLDGSLFLTLGDQGDANREDAQSPKRLNGKLLHFDVDAVMREHPDPLSLVYASGLRNPYGIDVHPVTGLPIVTDNGPDMCDELNMGRPGANYGNPTVECSAGDPRFDDPIWDSGPDRLGVTGLRVYRGSMFPEHQNQVLFCSVNTGNLMRAVLTPDFMRVERLEEVVSGADGEGCRLDVAIGPDGSIYYASMSKIYRMYR